MRSSTCVPACIDRAAPRKKAATGKKGGKKAPTTPAIVQTSGLCRLPPEVLHSIGHQVVAKEQLRSTRVLLAFSSTCRSLLAAFDGFWLSHYAWRTKMKPESIAAALTDSGRSARDSLVASMRDKCFGCGSEQRGRHDIFGYPVCYGCRQGDDYFLFVTQVRTTPLASPTDRRQTQAKQLYGVTATDLAVLSSPEVATRS